MNFSCVVVEIYILQSRFSGWSSLDTEALLDSVVAVVVLEVVALTVDVIVVLLLLLL